MKRLMHEKPNFQHELSSRFFGAIIVLICTIGLSWYGALKMLQWAGVYNAIAGCSGCYGSFLHSTITWISFAFSPSHAWFACVPVVAFFGVAVKEAGCRGRWTQFYCLF